MVEAAIGPDGPGPPGFCPGPATPPGQVEGSAQGSYVESLPLGRWAPVGANFYTALAGVGKQANLAPLEEMHSPLLASRDFSTGKRLTKFSVVLRPLQISFACHPAVRWGGKRKAPLNFSFPLEGKCHVVAKGCTRVSIPMKLTIVLLGPTSADLETLCRVSTKRRILARKASDRNAINYQSAEPRRQALPSHQPLAH